MADTLERIAHRQGGAFTRRQALRCDAAPDVIAHRLLTGEWLLIAGDVLIAATTPVTERTQAWIGVLALGQPVALAGRFGGSLLRLRTSYEVPEFAMPDNRTARTLPGMDVHRLRRENWRVTWRHGLPVLPAPVVIRQIAGVVSTSEARDVVQDALRRRIVSEKQLLAQLGRGLKGSAALRRVLEEVAPGYQVVWEQRLHVALLRAGVRLKPQCEVRTPDGRVAYIDLGDDEIKFGVEIDGFLNHMKRFTADRRRMRMLAAEMNWTIAPYATEELAVSLDRAVIEIAQFVRRRRRAAA